MPPLSLRRNGEENGETPQSGVATGRSTAAARERWCCRGCGAFICNDDSAREMAGAHQHRFTNPHGITFLVRCFDSAQGLRLESEATLEHSWFAGYGWRIAICATCQTHLGWFFESAGDSFYGLIAPRLVACMPPGRVPQ